MHLQLEEPPEEVPPEDVLETYAHLYPVGHLQLPEEELPEELPDEEQDTNVPKQRLRAFESFG